ncbi:hypothetical protein D3C81_2129730 [compost metagenome]
MIPATTPQCRRGIATIVTTKVTMAMAASSREMTNRRLKAEKSNKPKTGTMINAANTERGR